MVGETTDGDAAVNNAIGFLQDGSAILGSSPIVGDTSIHLPLFVDCFPDSSRREHRATCIRGEPALLGAVSPVVGTTFEGSRHGTDSSCSWPDGLETCQRDERLIIIIL